MRIADKCRWRTGSGLFVRIRTKRDTGEQEKNKRISETNFDMQYDQFNWLRRSI